MANNGKRKTPAPSRHIRLDADLIPLAKVWADRENRKIGNLVNYVMRKALAGEPIAAPKEETCP